MVAHIIPSPAGPDDVMDPWLHMSSHSIKSQLLYVGSRLYNSKRPAYNMLTPSHPEMLTNLFAAVDIRNATVSIKDIA